MGTRWRMAMAMVVVVAAMDLGATGARAQNLYPNGDFDDVDQIDGWFASFGQVGHGAADASGCPASGSVVTTTEATGPDEHQLRGWGPCVTLAEETVVDLRWVYRGGIADPASDVGVGAYAYPEASCAGTIRGGAGAIFQHEPAWTELRQTLEVSAGGSFRVFASGSGPVPGALEIDEIRATVQGYVFLDGFDGGGTCRWSELVVPRTGP